MHIADNLKQEEAWNYGASVSTYIPIFGKTLNVNAEYYYTDFLKLFCNTLNDRCVTKHVFITEDTEGKRQTHYNIRTRV